MQWMNGKEIANHSGGHLPFEGDVTNLVQTGAPNRVTVAINNTLTPHTLPPGTLSFGGPPDLPENYVTLNYQFDFFNYAGLHRPVKLYTTPMTVHVDDITVVTSLLSNGSAVVDYEVEVKTNSSAGVLVTVVLMEKYGGPVVSGSIYLYGCPQPGYCVLTGKGQLLVNTPRLWWPWTMNSSDPGYLYILEVYVCCVILHGYFICNFTLCPVHDMHAYMCTPPYLIPLSFSLPSQSSLTHSLTHSLTRSITLSLTHSLTHSPTHSLTQSLFHSLTQSLTHSLNHSFTHSHTHSLTHPLYLRYSLPQQKK